MILCKYYCIIFTLPKYHVKYILTQHENKSRYILDTLRQIKKYNIKKNPSPYYTMESYIFNDKEYYLIDDIEEYCPDFFIGIRKTSRAIITKYAIFPKDIYYGKLIEDKWSKIHSNIF